MEHAKLQTPDDDLKYFTKSMLRGLHMPHDHSSLESFRKENMKLGETIRLHDDEYINNGKELQPLRGRNLSHSLQTYSGKFIWPLEPYADEIDYISVAHGIACECRFGNQSPYPLPVAWHSVALSHVVPPVYAQAALIHDASEAFLKDIPRPIRRQEPFKGIYDEIEERMLRACFEHFGVDYKLMDNDEFLFYDIKMGYCEMTVWARTSLVYKAKMNNLFDTASTYEVTIEDSLDEDYIKWVEKCPRHEVWQRAETAWIERYNELF